MKSQRIAAIFRSALAESFALEAALHKHFRSLKRQPFEVFDTSICGIVVKAA